MSSVEDRIREMLREHADDIGAFPESDPVLERRARRRAAVTMGAYILTTTAAIVGVVLGLTSLRTTVGRPIAPVQSPGAVHQNGTITFTSGGKYWAVDPRGTGKNVRLPIPSNAQSISWSPGGSQLVYTLSPAMVKRASSAGLYV